MNLVSSSPLSLSTMVDGKDFRGSYHEREWQDCSTWCRACWTTTQISLLSKSAKTVLSIKLIVNFVFSSIVTFISIINLVDWCFIFFTRRRLWTRFGSVCQDSRKLASWMLIRNSNWWIEISKDLLVISFASSGRKNFTSLLYVYTWG